MLSNFFIVKLLVKYIYFKKVVFIKKERFNNLIVIIYSWLYFIDIILKYEVNKFSLMNLFRIDIIF